MSHIFLVHSHSGHVIGVQPPPVLSTVLWLHYVTTVMHRTTYLYYALSVNVYVPDNLNGKLSSTS